MSLKLIACMVATIPYWADGVKSVVWKVPVEANGPAQFADSESQREPKAVVRRVTRTIEAKGNSDLVDAAGEQSSTRSSISIFCFAWSTWTDAELSKSSAIVAQMAACDGHAIFSHRDDEHLHSTKVLELPSRFNGDTRGWLMGSNMVGLMPAWSKILKDPAMEKYDWFVNVETDHYFRPSQIRRALGEREKGHCGTTGECINKPLFTEFGNVYGFNRKMVQEMRRQWSSLGRVRADGCPVWTLSTHDCPQDVLYTIMARAVMDPPATELRKVKTRACIDDYWEMQLLKIQGKITEWDTSEIQKELFEALAKGTSPHEGRLVQTKEEEPTTTANNAMPETQLQRFRQALEAAKEAYMNRSIMLKKDASLNAAKIIKVLEEAVHEEMQRSLRRSKACLGTGKFAEVDMPDPNIAIIHHVYKLEVYELAHKKLGLN